MQYYATVNENTFTLTPDDIAQLDIIPNGADAYHILENQQAYQVKVLQTDFDKKTFEIAINGNPYTIQLADKYDQLIKQLGLTVKSAQQVKDIKAPMPGLVLSIDVEAGQTVEKGTPLLILEAMKMENVLKSPGDGVIKSVEVQQGVAVEKGQVLIEMEQSRNCVSRTLSGSADC